ncbi:MAG: hypothetical protein HYY50_03250 [Candidatus Kerfeldbacteria bacterium]|nr:hypothetical protein [Candidatus Kerfeldbacteria bacterium]
MIIGIILLLIALAEFILGLYLIFSYQRSQATMWYGLFALGISFYVASNGLGYMQNNFYIAERMGWLGGLMTAIFILPFSWTFPLPRKKVNEILPYVIWPLAVFVPGIFWTSIFLSGNGVIDYIKGYQTSPGPYFWFMLIFFFAYWIWALANLVYRFTKSDGQHRWMLKMILVGIGLSLLVSVVFDIIYPLVAISKIGYVGSLFSAIWLGFTSYIILKK